MSSRYAHISTKSSSSYDGVAQEEAPLQAPPDTRGRPYRALGWVLIKGVGLTLALLLPLCLLFWYIYAHNDAVTLGKYVFTTAPVHEILTVSQITSKVAEKIVVPAMAVFAYFCAADWLRGSQSGDATLPTPLQFGILQVVLGSANWFASYDGALYMLGRSGHSRRPRAPPFIAMSVILLLWLLTLEALAFFADVAFHQTTVNAVFSLPPTSSERVALADARALVGDLPPLDWTVDPDTITVSSNDSANARAQLASPNAAAMLLGRRVNETECASWSRRHALGLDLSAKDSCGLSDGSTYGNYGQWAPEGQRTFANSSALQAVAWTDDAHSIIVAAAQPKFSYTAIASGVKATCASITSECTQCYREDYSGPPCGPVGFLNLNCNGPHAYNGTARETGWLNVDGDVRGSSAVPASNPLRWGTIVISQAYLDYKNGRGTATHDNTTGFVVWGNVGATNVLHCELAVRLVTYRFEPPSTYTTLDTHDVSPEAAQRFTRTTALFDVGGRADLIGTMINGAGQLASDPYPEVYGRTLSRYIMAYSGIMMASTPVSTLEGRPVAGTRIHLGVFGFYAAVIFVEVITVCWIAIVAFVYTWNINDMSVRAVRKRITAPFGLICQFYGVPRRPRTESGVEQKKAFFTEDNLQLFEPEADSGATGLKLRKALYTAPVGARGLAHDDTWNLIVD
ncbi:hypothetical protein IE81DRAFT_350863 [Ceraceosorus guamensis]|uniref:Uncharacterized protein n=1 Tax=Ceraceosorus guamensis TaxID=1522189 RepID=A0A316VQF4_9BASI|nr:hypothetical protein IE81DRAFT_350863 [Ceraceosorus guamensis]PWN38653.1 hypothetical protein IE81DRAFT_350863 [Ceraceosorus guamensis]